MITTASHTKNALLLMMLFSLFGINTAVAQNDLIPPVPLQKVAPEAPAGQFGPAPDGWLKIRYSVLKDGSTANIQILNVMPPKMSTAALLKTVAAWTFTPAMSKGNAINWHNNIEYVIFDDELMPNLAGPMIGEAYERVQGYLEGEKYQRAKNRAERMIRESLFSLYDIGLANMQLASVEVELEDYHAAYSAIKLATPAGINLLSKEEMEVALQYRFSIALVLGQLTDAVATYDQRLALSPLAEDHYMRNQGEAIRSALTGDGALAIKAKIEAKNTWNHAPSRRIFTITDVNGKLNSIEITCNRGITSIEFQADSEWALPASWGECSLDILGDDGTTFTFYELK